MVALAAAGLAASGAWATISTTGNISPNTHPSTWTWSLDGGTDARIGNTADGALTINGGSSVAAYWLRVGANDGVGGTITVNGPGSTFQSQWVYLAEGFNSSAAVNVTNGATVTSGALQIAYSSADTSIHPSPLYPGSTASVTIDGAGSKWTMSSNVAIGSFGTGSLTITNGGSFYNDSNSAGYTFVGEQEGAVGTLKVDGVGSTFYTGGLPNHTSISLDIGYNGHGTLIVTNGGTVTSGNKIRIGVFSNASALGTAIVNGTGSSLNAGQSLFVGDYSESVSYGAGRLSVSNGGKVTAASLTINANPKSVLTADVGRGSSIIVGDGTGTINNYGKIRLVAGAGAAPGAYTPMSYGNLSGNAPMALGGVWNGTDHTVTVNAATAAAGIGGATAAFNLAVAQRAIITDTLTGHSAGAAFQAGAGDVTFNAAALSPTALAALQSLLTSGNTVLSAWNFSTTGTTVSNTNPAYLSLFAGPHQNLSTLGIWHYNGSTWSAYDAYDLAYNGTYASFTVTGFSGYAVSGTTPTPIPAGVWLLGPGLAGLAGMRRRLFKK